MSRSVQRLRAVVVGTVLATLAAGVAGAPVRAAVSEKSSPSARARAKAVAQDPGLGAIAKARADGEPVLVSSLTDEYSTTSANPDGTLTQRSSSSPQRVLQDGAWVPIDTTLVKQGDGDFAPKASASSLTVSHGRGASLLTMRDGSRSLTFTWPKKLPAATVSGDTATYPNVFPDVDLQVIADPTGYSSMLVIKNEEAATNPELSQVDFGITGKGVSIASTPAGGATATDARTGRQVFHTDTAAMWDSSPATGENPIAGLNLARNARDARVAAGRMGGHRSRLAVGIRGGKQSLVLDRTLLTAKTTKYPVFVDPVWSGSPSQQKWARISSNGWNVYNSTSTTGGTSARIGYDTWPGGAGERAKTYYQMNTAGVRGAHIFAATLYVTQRWAASCYNTAAVVYGTAAPSGWNSSKLYWGHEPAKATGVLSTVNSQELNCGKSTVKVSPPSMAFNVTSYVTTVAAPATRGSSATFLVQAKDMNDEYAWKQLGYRGGATLSIKYSYAPKLLNGTGTPGVTPSVLDQGRTLTTTGTPTLSAKGVNPKVNGIQEKVRIDYQVFNAAGTMVKTGYSGYSLNGGTWTTPLLTDGNYTWRAAVENESGRWAGVFTAVQRLAVDTVAPHQPTVGSAQFPAGQVGGAYVDKGVFVFGNDGTNNVTGYLFSLDRDLADVTYAANHGTAWSATTTLAPGTIYYAHADNANGAGAVVVNGTAGVSFAPVTSGAHTVYVKAVDQAGSTSPQKPYVFNAGINSPVDATGAKLVSGWTATNSDGSTTAVPAGTYTSAGGKLVSQAAPAGQYFADGFQAVLANNGAGKVAKADTATVSFDIPATGLWEIGANLTTGPAGGVYDLVLDQGQTTSRPLVTGFDAYNRSAATNFRNFGVIKDAGNSPLSLAKGVHTITVTVTGSNASSSGFQAGIDLIHLAPVPICAINHTTSCMNSTTISTYIASPPAVTEADADGSGASFDATDLKAAGWTPGSTITVNGAAVTLPAVYGTGSSDNILSNGQVVTVPATGVVNKGNTVVFLGFATGGPVYGATGTINYAGSSCGKTSQAFTIDAVSAWSAVPPSEAILTLPHYNKNNATRVNAAVSVSAFSVPLSCPGAVVQSVVLPVVTNIAQAGKPALHVLGLGIRPTSITDTTHWVGSWATAQDTATMQTSAGVNATLAGQTLRIPARLSIGTGSTSQQVRVHLANSLGATPVTFDAASIALQDATAGGATTTAAPIPLTFGGSPSVTLAAGADVVSGPVTLTAPDRTVLLVSLKPHGTFSTLAGHRDTRSPIYLTAADGVDHTSDLSAGGFTAANLAGMPYLSGIDVTTPGKTPAGAVVLFGDQTINSDTAAPVGLRQIDNQLADALADPDTGLGDVPLGILNLGSSSWGNRIQLPAGNGTSGRNATVLADRAILSQTNARVALISAGSTDLLACTSTTADACAKTVEDKLTALASQLHSYQSDDAPNTAVPLPGPDRSLKVYVATLPPFTGRPTTVQEAAREQVNAFIDGSDGGNLDDLVDGVINFAAAVSTGSTDNSPTVLSDYTYTDGANTYPNDLYYETLAQEYLADSDRGDWATDDQSGGTDDGAGATGVWKLDQDPGSSPAQDTGTGTGSGPTTHPAYLTDVTWGRGRVIDRQAATFNGTSSYARTDLKANTTQDFTVSAWVKLADKSTDRTIFARGSTGDGSFTLQYDKADDRWLAKMPSATSGDGVTWFDAESESVPKTGVWTHLAATYDGGLHRLTLYVNGNAEGAADDVTAFNDDTGATWIGRSSNTWFAGNITDVRVWARTLDPAGMADWAAAEPIADWEFDSDTDVAVAVDSTDHALNGTLSAGATHSYPGRGAWDIGVVTLNGTTGKITSDQLLLTDQSFSVAAWARITKANVDATVISQDGAHTSRFMLQWGAACTCWKFVIANTDAAAPTTTVAAAASSSPANTWTHLAASYDAGTGVMTLYINGQPAQTTTATATTWPSSGAFTVGRNRSNDQDANWFPGDIDAVRVYQGTISSDQLAEAATS